MTSHVRMRQGVCVCVCIYVCVSIYIYIYTCDNIETPHYHSQSLETGFAYMFFYHTYIPTCIHKRTYLYTLQTGFAHIFAHTYMFT